MKNLWKILTLSLAIMCLSFMPKSNADFTVIIDAGHGGIDNGAKTNEHLEKEITKLVAEKVKELNTDRTINIVLTRTTDEIVSLKDRVDLINSKNPNLVISLHVNQNQKSDSKGFEVFIANDLEKQKFTKAFAKKLADKIESNTSLNNRGINTAPFFLLNKSNAPTLLLEMGFISNEEDKNFIISQEGQTKMAQSILDFIYSVKQ